MQNCSINCPKTVTLTLLRHANTTCYLMLKLLTKTQNLWHSCLYQHDCEADSWDGMHCRGVQLFSMKGQSKCFSLPVATKLPLLHRPPVVSHWASTAMHVTPTPESCWAHSTRRYSRSHRPIHLPSLDLWLWADLLSAEGENDGHVPSSIATVSENTHYTMRARKETHVQRLSCQWEKANASKEKA